MSHVAGSVKTFSCPSCGGSVSIRAAGISITAVCQSCGSVIDTANDNFQIISKSTAKIVQGFLPIGARGVLFDVEWEVIGYMERECRADGENYGWEEYLLFNPWQGFRFLVQSDGHWTLVSMLRKDIYLSSRSMAEFDGTRYRLFSSDTAKVTYVLGEFYWRVQVGETTQVADYIAPPYLLSYEKNDSEITWSHGVYIEPDVICKAFTNGSEPAPLMPAKHGIAPNQPSSASRSLGGIRKAAWLLFFALLLIELVFVFSAKNTIVYTRDVVTMPSQKGQVFASEPFDLSGNKANVEITVISPVNNNWFELNTSLTNQETQETYSSSQVVEYYYGNDSDGAWSEGSQNNSAIISAVPEGKYRLLIAADAGAYARQQGVNFSIIVKRDVPVLSNFFAALALIVLYPLLLKLSNYFFEKRRWANSNYAPKYYASSNDSSSSND